MRSLGTGTVVLGLGVIAEVDVIGQDFSRTPLVALLVCPVTELEPAFHHGHASLGKVFRYELGGMAPGHDVDKIGFFLPIL